MRLLHGVHSFRALPLPPCLPLPVRCWDQFPKERRYPVGALSPFPFGTSSLWMTTGFLEQVSAHRHCQTPVVHPRLQQIRASVL